MHGQWKRKGYKERNGEKMYERERERERERGVRAFPLSMWRITMSSNLSSDKFSE